MQFLLGEKKMYIKQNIPSLCRLPWVWQREGGCQYQWERLVLIHMSTYSIQIFTNSILDVLISLFFCQ